MDGQTREGKVFGLKPNQAVRHGREARRDVFAERNHHKPRQALNNITAGVREREDENGTKVVGHLDEIQGVIANHIKVAPSWVVGFIDWVGLMPNHKILISPRFPCSEKT
jgi:hypothetical protein